MYRIGFLKVFLASAVMICAISAGAFGQGKFTYEDIAEGRFAQRSVWGVNSMADGEYYTATRQGRVIAKYSYATGEELEVLLDLSDYYDKEVRFYDYAFDGSESHILLRLDSRPVYRRSWLSSYAVYDFKAKRMIPVSDSPDLQYAALSPDGSKVAYVLGNNVYVRSLPDGDAVQVTTDGSNDIINGFPDWVYEEEFELYNSLSWSPDGRSIAYLRFDQSEVREYHMLYYTAPFSDDKEAYEEYINGALASPNYNTLVSVKYPKAGESNSVVELYRYDVEQEAKTRIDVGPERDQYVPFFDWTPDNRLYYFRINRLQNHLEIVLTDSEGGGKVIYDEQNSKYIDEIGLGTITFMPDSKRFVVRSETISGRFHLYMYEIGRGYRYAITEGNWDVTDIACVTDKRIWFVSNEGSPLRRDLYSIDIKGKNKKRLSGGDGTYRMAAGEGCKYYISYFSNSATPNTVTLHTGDGTLIRTLEDNAALKEYLADMDMPVKEFSTFGITDLQGREWSLNYYMVRPSDFDASKRYPVLLTQYSGPGSQEVGDRWKIDWEDALVQEGYIVVCLDPRGTTGQGEEFKKLTYARMGELETRDQIAFARYIGSLPYVDSERLGIYGWSYGGFMSLNCILHGADVFSTAISVAPVTSWRYYDSVYTERVNGLPQDNAEGYNNPSPLFHADKLEGRLLLMHGTGDDNVHIQNAYTMIYELVNAGKKFDMMIYTDANHSMMPYARHHIRQKMIDYCLDNL